MVILALGLVCVVEGLVFALAPARIEELLALLARVPVDMRRMIGLGTVAAGVLLIWLARLAGA